MARSVSTTRSTRGRKIRRSGGIRRDLFSVGVRAAGLASVGRCLRPVLGLWLVVGSLLAVESGTAIPVNRLADDGQIREWVVLGPFQGVGPDRPQDGYAFDFLAAHGGELTASWTAGQRLAGPDGRDRQAVAVSAWAGGYCEHRSYDGYVGYALCLLDCPATGDYLLYLASNGSPRLWLNGVEVLGRQAERHPHRRWQYGRRVRLQAGLNELRLKIANRRGYWGFQVECFDEASHAAVWPSVVRRLDLTALELREGRLHGRVEPWPQPIGVQLPLAIRCPPEAAPIEAQTGSVFSLAPPADNEGTVELVISSPAVERPLRQACYLGDLDAAWQDIGRRLAALPVPEGPWAPLLADFAAWVRYRVAQPHDYLVARDVADLAPIDRLLTHWEAGGDPVADHPWISFPARRRVGAIDWLYRFQLRAGATEGPLPVLVNLHGAGGTDRPIGFGGDPASPPAAADTMPAHLRLAPRAQRGVWWQSDALGDWLDALQAELPIDTERISCTGFSMGGMATWSWATDQPQRFAALGPLAGYGDPTRVQALRHIPVWAAQGDRDSAIPPHLAERSVAALQAAGGCVRYTLLSDRGHGLGDSFDGAELDRWLLAQRRQVAAPEPVPSAPDDEGVTIVRRPARTVLVTELLSDPWSLDRDLTAAETRLATVWRRSGRLYDVAPELLVAEPALLAEDRWPLALQMPEGVPVDCWGSQVERRRQPVETRAQMALTIAGPDALATQLNHLLTTVRQAGHRPTGPVAFRLDHRRRYGEERWVGVASVAIAPDVAGP